jgi:cysteine-rich repeat protein
MKTDFFLSRCSDCCKVEDGWECKWNSDEGKSECFTDCGDSKLRGFEQCDDGNESNGDGCSDICEIEDGWKCKWDKALGKTVCTSRCGDGYTVGSEECDDGNTASGDGCSASCTKELGYVCTRGEEGNGDNCEPIVSTPSLEECNAFASKFDNTCKNSDSIVEFDSLRSQNRKCYDVNKCPVAMQTDSDGTFCRYTRKLCVKCFERDGLTWLRVQTNSYPSHCYYSHTTAPLENKIDFEIYFNPTFGDWVAPVFTASNLDSQVCNPTWPLS